MDDGKINTSSNNRTCKRSAMESNNCAENNQCINSYKQMEILDLSFKPGSTERETSTNISNDKYNNESNDSVNTNQHVIYLSDDEHTNDDALDSCDQASSDGTRREEDEDASAVHQLSLDLRSEEAMLTLLKSLKENQECLHQTNNSEVSQGSQTSPPKVTLSAALELLEHQLISRRYLIRRHTEKCLSDISLPKPTGSDTLHFFPSPSSVQFLTLVGLDHVINHMLNSEANNRASFDPFVCSQCGTDSASLWKQEPGFSPAIYCEDCVAANERDKCAEIFTDSIKEVLVRASDQESRLEKEFKQITENPNKLALYQFEQERLLASQYQTHRQKNTAPSPILRGNTYPFQSPLSTSYVPGEHSMNLSAADQQRYLRQMSCINPNQNSHLTGFHGNQQHTMNSGVANYRHNYNWQLHQFSNTIYKK